MAQKKYRVHEVGKDFNVKSNDILDLIKEYFGEESNNHMRVLSDEELDIIFETYTQREGFGTLPDYFATYVPRPTVVKKAEPAQVPEKPAEVKKPEVKIPAAHAENISQERPAQIGSDTPAKKQEQSQQPQKQKPQKHKFQTAVIQPKAAPATGVTIVDGVQTQTLGQTKVVDTRKQLNVNLAKYDERLNDIVGEKANRDYGKSKQKIKGKNKRPSPFRREDEQAKLKRLEQYEKDKKKHLANVVLPEQMSVSELAASLRMTNAQVVKKLMLLGIMASASQIIDYDTASLVAEELGAKVTKEVVVTIEDKLIDDSDDSKEDLVSRSPVVVVMGHVDHGKTSLLDAIRHTSVTTGEAGGITQHIGAYKVNLNGKDITFLDTPGHAAFTSMRARGAQVTDVVILVVAADDGIMPQTIEAINHSKAAGVPIVVAVNKMDRPEANFDKVLQALTEYELVPEQWGGDVICVPVSAVKGEGISDLLENVLLIAEMRDLKANPNREAKGTVIEAKLDKGRGPVATVLVQNGTLHSGDVVVAGTTVGRVRVMTDDKGVVIKEAIPSTPVEIIGLSEVPSAGDLFYAVKDEKMARELVEQRKHEQKEELNRKSGSVTLEDMFSRIQEGNMKTLNIIIKADVQGSAEAVRASLEKLTNEEVRVSVIHCAVGSVTESDIMLANASNAIIVGFNIRPDANARLIAEKDGVDIRLYRIIYDCIEEIEAAMKGMLAPKFKEVSLGQAEVRQTFKVTGVGTIAGCLVKDGKIVRSAKVRLVRDGIVVYEGEIDSLKRFKDDAKEVAEGYECGIGLVKYNDVKEGDIIEAYIDEEIKQ
ncbi:MAG: translation initiation factor IF-2 [Clostridiales bacterium]|nr:MAG: translation initiation factor IF-2 [Clostridiales bacterium]